VDKDENSIKVSDLASLLGVTTRRITQLTKEGIVLKKERGNYDKAESIKRYRELIRQNGSKPAIKDEPIKELSYHDARTKKINAEAQLKELELRKREGELLDITVAQKHVFENIRAIRDAFLNLPDRTSAVLASLQTAADVHDELTREIRVVLEDLSDFKLTGHE